VTPPEASSRWRDSIRYTQKNGQHAPTLHGCPFVTPVATVGGRGMEKVWRIQNVEEFGAKLG
jgi:hypothetical protein